MKQKLIYLIMAVLAVMVMASCTALAADKDTDRVSPPWQRIDIGPAEDYIVAFDTSTIRYDRNSDGSINKNIIIYDEKKINDIPMSTEYAFYTITNTKVNVANQSICFGDESSYTRKDKLRWTDKPTYLAWITVKPETLGGLRFIAIVDYAKTHDEELTARS